LGVPRLLQAEPAPPRDKGGLPVCRAEDQIDQGGDSTGRS
jgi:hypothetical protein